MSLPETLPLPDFADLLRVTDLKFELVMPADRSAATGGIVLYATRATPLWRIEATSVPMPISEAKALAALARSRGPGIKTALLCDPSMRYPSTDPDGAIFGSATPTIDTITNRENVSFAGFPAAYSLPIGTYFGVIFNTSAYYLGTTLEARTADVSGAVATTSIWPPLPESISEGDGVTVLKPPAKFRIVPGSIGLSFIGAILAQLSFAAEQTYES